MTLPTVSVEVLETTIAKATRLKSKTTACGPALQLLGNTCAHSYSHCCGECKGFSVIAAAYREFKRTGRL